MFEFVIAIIAIENIADILTGVDLLETWRQRFETLLPKLGRLARCKYCQMFWLSLIFFCLCTPPACVLLALAAHRISTLLSEFCDRYLNRAPTHLFVQTTNALESESLQK